MARTRAVRFAPGAACGGRLAAEDCADRMVVTTRRELSACGPALPRGTSGHLTLLTQRVAKPRRNCVRRVTWFGQHQAEECRSGVLGRPLFWPCWPAC